MGAFFYAENRVLKEFLRFQIGVFLLYNIC